MLGYTPMTGGKHDADGNLSGKIRIFGYFLWAFSTAYSLCFLSAIQILCLHKQRVSSTLHTVRGALFFQPRTERAASSFDPEALGGDKQLWLGSVIQTCDAFCGANAASFECQMVYSVRLLSLSHSSRLNSSAPSSITRGFANHSEIYTSRLCACIRPLGVVLLIPGSDKNLAWNVVFIYVSMFCEKFML